MKRLLTVLLLFAFIGSFPTLTANAQVDFGFDSEDEEEEGPKVINPYADKYKPDITVTEEERQGGIVPNFIYYVGFKRLPDASPDDLNLFIVSPGYIIGCLNMDQPFVEPIKSGNALQLKITDGYIDVDYETIRYFHYECKPETGFSEIQLTLSKQQLMDDGIEKLVIVSESIGPFNEMLLDYDDHSITITSTTKDLSRLGLPMKGSTDTYTYWIYPENTMALLSSGLDLRDEEIMAKARAFARSKGLTPLDEIIPGFMPRRQNMNKLYVVDQKGLYRDQFSSPEEVNPIGKIETSETYFGPNGPYEKPVQKTIYARMPGLYE